MMNVALRSKQQLYSGRVITLGEDPREVDENLELFSRIRQKHLIAPHSEFNCQNSVREVGTLILAKSRIDDLLSANDGKHEYDWLLTPPTSPPVSSSRSSDNQPSEIYLSGNLDVVSASIGTVLRLSESQFENDISNRSTRISSTTKSSISTSYSSSSYEHQNNRTSILNTSIDSITSHSATPGSSSTSRSTSRAAKVPPARSAPGCSATPTKYCSSTAVNGDKPKACMKLRTSTANSRPQTHFSSSNPRTIVPPARSSTRRTPTITPASSRFYSASVNRITASNSQKARPPLPSSPAPRAQPQSKLPVLPDFPFNTPANLRTKLPERVVAAGRYRPGLALTVGSNLNSKLTNPLSPICKQSTSSTVTRGRIQENATTTRSNVMLCARSKKLAAVEYTFHKPKKVLLLRLKASYRSPLGSLDVHLRQQLQLSTDQLLSCSDG